VYNGGVTNPALPIIQDLNKAGAAGNLPSKRKNKKKKKKKEKGIPPKK